MLRFTSFAMLSTASAFLAVQLSGGFRASPAHGVVNACPAEYEAAAPARTIPEIIARFEEWKGGLCEPRREKPLFRG